MSFHSSSPFLSVLLHALRAGCVVSIVYGLIIGIIFTLLSTESTWFIGGSLRPLPFFILVVLMYSVIAALHTLFIGIISAIWMQSIIALANRIPSMSYSEYRQLFRIGIIIIAIGTAIASSTTTARSGSDLVPLIVMPVIIAAGSALYAGETYLASLD